MWPTSVNTTPTSSRVGVGFGLPPEMGMFVVASPATTFHHHYSGGSSVGGTTMMSSQHHHHHHPSDYMSHQTGGGGEGNNAGTALGVGVGVIPLLGTADEQDLIGRTWQQQIAGNKKSIDFDLPSSSGMSLSGTATCQDCGNQSKKDCSHQRCRTCCRSRGFDCSTHVKSTWIPAAKRRERQAMTGTSGGGGGGGGGGGASSGSTSGVKKPRLISSQTSSHTSTSNTPPRSFDASSSHQDGSFKETLPGQVRAPAVFKCVKVTAVEDGEDEFAYQAVVKIGGHLFKGFLYDQGVESRDTFPNLSELHLGGGSVGGGNGGGRNGPLLDPSDVYGASGGGLIGGSNYGNTINSLN